MLCLCCFVVKQSGVLVGKSEKPKIAYETTDGDCEDEDESQKGKFENLHNLAPSEDILSIALLKYTATFPSLTISYQEFLHFPVSPPPDFA
ncbi:MAG: hypothetical protein NWP83_01820 [Spirosomaceae bacterium]|nr:hypothetical protein [Spirosomataceae bacterium]